MGTVASFQNLKLISWSMSHKDIRANGPTMLSFSFPTIAWELPIPTPKYIQTQWQSKPLKLYSLIVSKSVSDLVHTLEPSDNLSFTLCNHEKVVRFCMGHTTLIYPISRGKIPIQITLVYPISRMICMGLSTVLIGQTGTVCWKDGDLA